MLSTPTAEVNKIFAIIADEVGVPVDELTGDVELTDLGVDDLLSKSIISKITEMMKLKLPATTFQDFDTADSLRSHLEETLTTSTVPTPNTTTTVTRNAVTVISEISDNTRQCSPPIPTTPLSFLLQGKPASSKSTIFLLPDGSGSGMAYSMLPRIDADVCLVALNSPYLPLPQGHHFTVSGIAAIWAEEIQRRQPDGPYILGGWSAGGYYSFEVTRYLTRRGQQVSKLILLDSPCRLVYEELPMEVVQYLSHNGLMGNWGKQKPPAWVVNHFDITIDAVSKYVPAPLDPKTMPEVFIIWARDGVLEDKGIQAEDTGLDFSVKITKMLVQRPEKDGALGWDRLLPSAKLAITNMSGNHFTMVHQPNAESLSTLLRDCVMDTASKRKGRWHFV